MDAAGISGVERDDAILVLSELVSNSVKHAAALPSGEIAVRWALGTDGGAATVPRAGAAALSALGGRGLEIVRTLCRRWGVIEGEQGVTVWADVPRPGVGRRELAAD
jgi:two-component sensor histidine kinase